MGKMRIVVFLMVLCLLFQGAASAASVKSGMRGDDVRKVQELLLEKGYFSGKVDGICGKETVDAIRHFQKDKGLKVDGICGPQTMKCLQGKAEAKEGTESVPAGIAVKLGTRGKDVEHVQELLIEKGFLSGSVDGICGPVTVNAIKRFQRKAGLAVDGVCGPITYAALQEAEVSGKEPVPEEFPSGRVVFVEATAYSSQDPGLSSHTASGTLVRHGVIAVDPSFIPLGTKVFIPDYGMAVAEDIGWGIHGNRIDIAFDTHSEALSFGCRSLEIYILD